jgi:hypothetical protein
MFRYMKWSPNGFTPLTGGKNMTVFPSQINEVIQIYNRVAKLKPSALVGKEHDGPQDAVTISAEAKKKQILSQAKDEVLERIRDAR